MTSRVQTDYVTPPQISRRLRVSCEKVIGWLLAGELKGVNLASRTSKRPRYRIAEHDLAEFLERRSASVKPAVSVTRRRRKETGVREYF